MYTELEKPEKLATEMTTAILKSLGLNDCPLDVLIQNYILNRLVEHGNRVADAFITGYNDENISSETDEAAYEEWEADRYYSDKHFSDFSYNF
jgi:hypothetical protein